MIKLNNLFKTRVCTIEFRHKLTNTQRHHLQFERHFLEKTLIPSIPYPPQSYTHVFRPIRSVMNTVILR
ncbi:unnamed protein product [Lathyrus sativus]|nr:unnamed protein product [Lathyrus sativus]